MSSFLGILREIADISELTGLSVGTLIGLAALVYFFPPARALAIQVAVVVVAAYFVGLYEHRVGRAEVEAEWKNADAAAASVAEAHDAAIGDMIKAEYVPQ